MNFSWKCKTIFVVFLFIIEHSSADLDEDDICGGKKRELVAHPKNCSLYFKCSQKKVSSLNACQPGFWFDPRQEKCENIQSFSQEQADKCADDSQSAKKLCKIIRRCFKTTALTPTTPTTKTTKATTTKSPNKKNYQKVKRCFFPVILADSKWLHEHSDKNDDKKQSKYLPKSISIKLPTGKQTTTQLNLAKKPNSTDNLVILCNTRGRVEKWVASENETWSVYSDLKTESSISVATRIEGGKRKLIYDGSFVANKTRYSLRPNEGKRSYPLDPNKTKFISLNDTTHILTEENYNAGQYDFVRAEQSGPANVTSVMTDLEKLVNAQLQSTSSQRRFGLELFIVLDYSIFYKWYAQSSETTPSNKISDAIYNIRYFYTHIVNGINDRYASIQQNDMSFYVKLVGYYIAQTPSDSLFTEKPGIKLSSSATQAYYALDEFEKWIADNAKPPSPFPRFDSAALFTDYTMLAYNSYGTYPITGLANIGTTCTLRGVSINKDFGQYATIETASHEIGHNLGAWHDGSENTCGASDQFIMSPAPGSLTNQTFNNPFTFSQCSINYFRNYIAQLDQGNNNCLLNEAFDVEPTDQAGFLQQYPGQKYSVDKQCQLLYGQNAFYCAGGGERDASICRELKCYDPSQGKCVSRVEQRALDGTTCSNKFWCIRGVCVADNRASAAPASCIYGDYKDVFNYQSGSISCSYMTSNLPWMCYDNYYSALCCTSCAKIRNNKFPGCEYGDRDNTCASISSRQCYDSNKQSQCCATCLKRELNLPAPNCRYGDKVSWCPTISASSCYSSNESCCQYCLQYQTNIPGCDYGDKMSGCTLDVCQYPSYLPYCCKTCQAYISTSTAKLPSTTTTTTTTTTLKPVSASCPNGDLAAWCSTITADACYGSSSTCCATCPKFYNPSNIGCEYGDQASWCSTYVKSNVECQKSEVASLCCASCKLFKSPNSETPSCPYGDQANYCSSINSWDCYSTKSICCKSCAKYFNSTFKDCEYGDQVPWCGSYVQGITECQRPEVAAYCCKTCANIKPQSLLSTTGPVCLDGADWCNGLFAGYCYDASVEKTCCATCRNYLNGRTGNCRYGDFYSWCKPEYCAMNSVECCSTCQ